MTPVRVFRDPDELGRTLAAEILVAYGRTDGRFLFGCPGGRSLLTTYRALAQSADDLSRLVVVLMDEYAGATVDAFLPPGAPCDGRTSLVELADSTRHDNLATFPGFTALAEVPRPASIVHEHTDAQIWLDEAAAA